MLFKFEVGIVGDTYDLPDLSKGSMADLNMTVINAMAILDWMNDAIVDNPCKAMFASVAMNSV